MKQSHWKQSVETLGTYVGVLFMYMFVYALVGFGIAFIFDALAGGLEDAGPLLFAFGPIILVGWLAFGLGEYVLRYEYDRVTLRCRLPYTCLVGIWLTLPIWLNLASKVLSTLGYQAQAASLYGTRFQSFGEFLLGAMISIVVYIIGNGMVHRHRERRLYQLEHNLEHARCMYDIANGEYWLLVNNFVRRFDIPATNDSPLSITRLVLNGARERSACMRLVTSLENKIDKLKPA